MARFLFFDNSSLESGFAPINIGYLWESWWKSINLSEFKSRLDKASKRLAPLYVVQFTGVIIGYLGGDWVVANTKPPGGLWVDAVIIGPLAISAWVVVHKYPPGSYVRENYKYWIGQLGAWLIGLLIGEFLPLMKSFASSSDTLTRLILVPWVLGILFELNYFQQWFKTPQPHKLS